MKRVTAMLLGLGLLAASPLLQAQPGGHHIIQKLQSFKAEANLTDEQTAQLKAIWSKGEDQRKKAMGEMKDARKTLETLRANKSTDEALYQKQLDILANANQSLQGLRQQSIAEVRGVLKPSQQAILVLTLTEKRHHGGDRDDGDGPNFLK